MLTTPPPPPPRPAGPPAPALIAVKPAPAVPAWIQGDVKALLRDLPGAVVVVEDEAPAPVGQARASVDFLRGRLRLIAAGAQVPFTATPGMPVWMDPTVVRSGGNTVHKVFALGGGLF